MFGQGDMHTLFIVLEKPVYTERSQVNGTIMLHTMVPLHASYLNLVFEGIEVVKFTKFVNNPEYTALNEEQRKTTTIPRTVPRHYKSRQCFYNTEQMVQRFPEDVIFPGSYQFPFSFTLGANIPNTFEHLWKTEQYQNEAVISYTLLARLSDRDNYTVGRETVKFLIIQNEQPNQMAEHQKIDQEHHVYNFCCANKGTIRLVTYFEKDWYYNDEDAYIVCEVDNSNSLLTVNQIKARLTQTLRVKAEGTVEENTREIASDSLQVDLKPEKKMTGGNAIRLKLKLSPLGNNKTDTTVDGDLIKCRHSLSVNLHLSGCCQSVPSHHLHVKVYARPPPSVVPSFASDFVPQKFAPYTFTPERSGKFDDGPNVNYPKI